MEESRYHFVAAICRGSHSKLQRYLRSKFQRDADAEDLTQDVYLRLMGTENLEKLENPGGYTFRTAGNLALDRIRAIRRGKVEFSSETVEEAKAACPAPSPEAVVYNRQLLAHLIVALESLPPKCRQALILHRCRGLTYDEVSKRLGVSTHMVKKYLSKAVFHCREHLNALDDDADDVIMGRDVNAGAEPIR